MRQLKNTPPTQRSTCARALHSFVTVRHGSSLPARLRHQLDVAYRGRLPRTLFLKLWSAVDNRWSAAVSEEKTLQTFY